ncbi:MAG: cell division protein FtsB [Gammaproteobacteria bacterium]|nr:cell division protein FtsB [Gammaproteobacteria bacterium]MCK5263082.1 cell division protein FtsB [Gammaproteobacteria bacterium]
MKKVIALLLVLLAMLQYKIWLGDGGIPEILQLENEVEVVQLQVDKLKERNQALEAEVLDLKKGMDAIEERARSELGMIGKDEVYYQVISSGSEKSNDNQSGSDDRSATRE